MFRSLESEIAGFALHCSELMLCTTTTPGTLADTSFASPILTELRPSIGAFTCSTYVSAMPP